MSEVAVGTIVLSVDGEEYDVIEVSPKVMTGQKPIPTMNREQRTKFKSKGNKSYELSLNVIIPDGKDRVDWTAVEDARISIESPDGNFRETYIDFNVTEASSTFSVSGDTVRQLSGFALDHIEESI